MLSDNRWQGPEQVSWVKLQDAFLTWKREMGYRWVEKKRWVLKGRNHQVQRNGGLGLGLGGDPTICPDQDFLTRAQVLGGIYKPW